MAPMPVTTLRTTRREIRKHVRREVMLRRLARELAAGGDLPIMARLRGPR